MALPNTSNVTLNVLNEIFQNIADRHAMINDYGFGDSWELGALTIEYYPLFWVTVLPSQMTSNTIVYNFRFIVGDLVHKDESNELEVQSDTIQILWDILNMMRQDYGQYEFDISPNFSQYNITATPFTEAWDDEISGWYTDIQIVVPRTLGSCDIPLKNDPLSSPEGIIYYGIKSDDNPFINDIDIINGSNFNVVNISSDITVNFTTFSGTPNFLYIAIPYISETQIKNHWFISQFNQGDIEAGGLFFQLQTITVDDRNYAVFLTTFESQLTDDIIFQNI